MRRRRWMGRSMRAPRRAVVRPSAWTIPAPDARPHRVARARFPPVPPAPRATPPESAITRAARISTRRPWAAGRRHSRSSRPTAVSTRTSRARRRSIGPCGAGAISPVNSASPRSRPRTCRSRSPVSSTWCSSRPAASTSARCRAPASCIAGVATAPVSSATTRRSIRRRRSSSRCPRPRRRSPRDSITPAPR